MIAATIVNNLTQVSVPAWGQESKRPKVALLINTRFTDSAWGISAYNASQILKNKYGLDLTTKENVSISDIEPTLRLGRDWK